MERKDLKEAKKYFNISYQLQKSFNDQSSMSESLKEMAHLHVELQDYKKAINYGLEALEIAESIESKPMLKDVYSVLSTAYSGVNNYKKAFIYAEKYIEIGVSLNNEIKKKEIYIELERNKYNTEKKELIANYQIERNTQEIKFLLEQKNKTIKQNGLIILVIIILVFAGVWYYRLRVSNQQKKLIESQKIIVDISNKEIMDSINYAQRIQAALLKAKDHVSKHLPPHFVLYKPKNIVSGDFYWYSEKKGFVYIAVADCTGHGVPGAMLSMLGISYLNEINSSVQIYSPAQILDLLKIKFVNELNQIDSSITISDGMDISLLRMNLNTGDVVWSGANNPLYIHSNSELNVINSTKQSISFTDKVIPFVDHQISFLPDAIYYLFSDGYIDQFGGPRGKKMKQTGFQKKLKEISNESLDEQLVILEAYFDEWKGAFEQLDDVTIIAIKSPELKN